MISQPDMQRYERQMMLAGWGREGQEKLRQARVLLVGVGGLGSAVATYLAVAGVGELRVIDCDKVELSNLNRQILYSDGDLGREKALVAKERLELLNPGVRVEAIADRITEENVHDLVADDLIVDATDNLDTRYILNNMAFERSLPLFHGAVYGFEGRATTIVPGKTSCLRCLYDGIVPGPAPVPGVTPAVIGCIQATEVLKYLLGIGELLTDRLLVYDGLSLRFDEVRLRKNPGCGVCK